MLGAATALLVAARTVDAASLDRIAAATRDRIGATMDEPALARGAAMSRAQALAVLAE